jgi:hypothetical protein
MIITNSIHDAFLHRTAKVEYSNEIQFAGFLREVEGTDDREILPGMVMKSLGNGIVDLYDGKGTPFGLASVFYARHFGKGGVNQLGDNNEFTVIVGNNTTTVRIAKAALDPAATFAFDADGTVVPVYANAAGRLTSVAAGGVKVANLLTVDADGSITIQLLDPSTVTA